MTETGPKSKGIDTDNYGFMKPTVGGDLDLWGNDYTTGDPATDPSPGLNGNWSKMDVLLKTMQDKIDALEAASYIRIGGMFLTAETFADGAAVTEALGYGTWTAHAAGRALVGVGTADGTSWAVGEAKGNSNVTLSASQIPTHSHTVNPPSTALNIASGGSHSHNIQFVQETVDNSGSFPAIGRGTGVTDTTDAGGSHTHTGTVDIAQFSTGNAGSGASHNNIQPSVGVYVWLRTA